MNEVWTKIRAWAEAKKVASENASLMCRSDAHLYSGMCADRMKVLAAAELDMLCMDGKEDLPEPLKRYIRAIQTKGCSKCWLTSGIPIHPDCSSAITEYFESEKALFDSVFDI